MFENLSERLQNTMHKIKGYGKITEDNISEMLREVRLSLLEADVNYKVVKEFTNAVKEKALGEEVNKSLDPGEQFVKIVKDEMEELLGGVTSKINFTPNPPTIIMLVRTSRFRKNNNSWKVSKPFKKTGQKTITCCM